MRILKEITKWDDPNLPSHIYHLNDEGDMVAYQPRGGDVFRFKKPMKFSETGRKFELLDTIEEVDPNTITVVGSKGTVYKILNGKCSCTGFKYRGTCKHVENQKSV